MKSKNSMELIRPKGLVKDHYLKQGALQLSINIKNMVFFTEGTWSCFRFLLRFYLIVSVYSSFCSTCNIMLSSQFHISPSLLSLIIHRSFQCIFYIIVNILSCFFKRKWSLLHLPVTIWLVFVSITLLVVSYSLLNVSNE